MFLLIKLAFRNLFRNTRRTLLAGTAIGIGLAALIFTDAMIIGMNDNMVDAATKTFLGDAQMHREGFRDTLEVEATIADGIARAKAIADDPDVEHAAARTSGVAMVTSPADSSPVVLFGLDPLSEPPLSEIDEKIVEGEYLKANDVANDELGKLLIGTKLAKSLELELGDKVVLTAAQAETGELSQEMFRIGGIFNFGVREMDGSMVFAHIDRTQKVLNIGAGVHEIAISFNDSGIARDVGHPFWARHKGAGIELLGWPELMPELNSALGMTEYATVMVAGLLFIIVALGILNTLFMSLYERLFEFGVLRAIGTRPLNMALIIIFEAGSLAIISILIGLGLGFGITALTAHTGISYVGIEYAGITFTKSIYPVMNLSQFTTFPVYLLIFTMLVGIYPGVFAAKLTPARAMKRSF